MYDNAGKPRYCVRGSDFRTALLGTLQMPENIDERRVALLAESEQLEAAAGLTEVMAKAKEGRFMPLGIDGEPCSSNAYFADEYDSFREQIRRAYFSINDIQVRIGLIRARRILDEHDNFARQKEATKLKLAEKKAASNLSQQPWTAAAILAALWLGVGYWIFDLAGAVGGAVVGYFLGNGLVASARAKAEAILRETKSDLLEAENDRIMERLRPEFFTENEELTGDRNCENDHKSALSAVLAHEKRA